MRNRAWRQGVVFAAAAICLFTVQSRLARAQPTELEALNANVVQLYNAGKYREAIDVAQRALAFAEKLHGPNGLAVGTALNNLGELYSIQGKFDLSEPILKRSLAIREKALGPDHLDVGSTLNNLGELYKRQGRYALAETVQSRSLAIREKGLGPDHPDVSNSLNNLASVYFSQGKFDLAEPLVARAIVIREKALGPDHPFVATTVHNLAAVYYAHGKYDLAKPLYVRSLAIRENALGPDHTDVAQSLQSLANLYKVEGKYDRAEPLYLRAEQIYEKAFDQDHVEVASVLNDLASIYVAQGQFDRAEPLYKRTLLIFEKVLGPDHPNIGLVLSNLAALYSSQGKYALAEPLYKRAVIINEKAYGVDHPNVGNSLNNLGDYYRLSGQYKLAEINLQRAVSLLQKALGDEHPNVAVALNNLALLYNSQGNYDLAESLAKRVMHSFEKSFGPNHEHVATATETLGSLYYSQGKYDLAAQHFNRALAIREKKLGADHPLVATALNNLGAAYKMQGKYDLAEPLYKRSLAIRERALGPDHPDVASSLNNIAEVYREQDKYDLAEPLYKRDLEITEKALGPKHPLLGNALNNLALLYLSQGKLDLAELPLNRSLAIREKALGPDHPLVAESLGNLGLLHSLQGKYDLAGSFDKRALAIKEQRLGADHPSLGLTLWNLAFLSAEKGDYTSALTYQRSASKLRIGRGELQGEGREARRHELAQGADYFRFHVFVADRARGESKELGNESFEMAQWALQTEASYAIAQMSARFASGGDALSDAVRTQQDLDAKRHAAERRVSAAAASADAPNAEAAREEIAALNNKIDELNERITKQFPKFAELTRPTPLNFIEVKAALADNEVLVAFLDIPQYGSFTEEAYAWIVTRKEAIWRKLSTTPTQINERVGALRCGLDEEAWSGLSQAARCGTLLGIDQPAGSDPLPFNLEIAHELYQALFGEVEYLIKGKRLLIVPSGPLTSLPFQVLVTKKPEAALPKAFEGYRGVPWLVRGHAVTVLPSVSSLKALREHAKSSASAKPYIGYGNPVLDGDGSCKEIEAPDTCPSLEVAGGEPQQVAVAEGPVRATMRGRSGRRSPDLAKVFAKGGGAEAVLAQVRALCPLPDTAYEIGCVAERLGVPRSEIRLDAAATEADLKALSDSGRLANYRVVHFATHGLLAGDVEAMAKVQGEPALVLTPPQEPKDADDNGLLTASEVTQLKLNADWIVLSACNTASGDKLGAEALSGLARAFFYAGARTLLVSHWPVYSDAAVRLTTRAFAEMDEDKTAGRAEAFQQAMIALMDDASQEDNAHPAVWAPFVVVGEGAR